MPTPKITFLIEQDMYDDGNPERMRDAAKELGHDILMTKFIPFEANKYNWPLKERDCVVVYGSLNLAKHVNKNHSFVPGTWCDFDKIRVQDYLGHWGQYSVHHNYGFYPLGDVIRRKDWIYQKYGKDESIFTRPNDNYKTFCGERVWSGRFNEWANWVRDGYVANGLDAWVMVSEPVKIIDEWRMVIKDKRVVTGSLYKKDGLADPSLTGYTDEVAAFAEKIANTGEYQPHPIYAIDVGSTEDGLKMIEMGAVNTCGLYGCDIKKVTEAMAEVAARDWEEAWGDSPSWKYTPVRHFQEVQDVNGNVYWQCCHCGGDGKGEAEGEECEICGGKGRDG